MEKSEKMGNKVILFLAVVSLALFSLLTIMSGNGNVYAQPTVREGIAERADVSLPDPPQETADRGDRDDTPGKVDSDRRDRDPSTPSPGEPDDEVGPQPGPQPDPMAQLQELRASAKELKSIGRMIGQGRPQSEIKEAWKGFLEGSPDTNVVAAMNYITQEALQEMARRQPSGVATQEGLALPYTEKASPKLDPAGEPAAYELKNVMPAEGQAGLPMEEVTKGQGQRQFGVEEVTKGQGQGGQGQGGQGQGGQQLQFGEQGEGQPTGGGLVIGGGIGPETAAQGQGQGQGGQGQGGQGQGGQGQGGQGQGGQQLPFVEQDEGQPTGAGAVAGGLGEVAQQGGQGRGGQGQGGQGQGQGGQGQGQEAAVFGPNNEALVVIAKMLRDTAVEVTEKELPFAADIVEGMTFTDPTLSPKSGTSVGELNIGIGELQTSTPVVDFQPADIPKVDRPTEKTGAVHKAPAGVEGPSRTKGGPSPKLEAPPKAPAK